MQERKMMESNIFKGTVSEQFRVFNSIKHEEAV